MGREPRTQRPRLQDAFVLSEENGGGAAIDRPEVPEVGCPLPGPWGWLRSGVEWGGSGVILDGAEVGCLLPGL
jgi:hypothetical protein